MPTDTTPLKKIYEEVCRFAHAPPSWLMSEKIIIGGIISYLESGSSDSFDSMLAYLHVSGNDSARSAKEVIKKIIREFPDFFIIEHLIVQHTHTTLPVLKQLLPLSAPAITSQEALCAAHGNHIFGLIGARLSEQNTVTKNTFDRIRDFDDGVVGIAPEADIVMLKAFHDQSFESDKKTITEALKRARLLAIDIVNMSLKVADTLDRDSDSTKEFEESIAQIPYIVAASGNDGSPRAPGYCGKKIGYPARFPSVDFTVGAFGCTDEGIAYIPDFSQYEPGIGPHYLCPGVEILSAGMQPRQDVDSSYIFLDGTSMATPIMTGFIALMLSEFKDNFSRQQISDVTKAATVRLENEPAWKTKVVYGVIDMRTALLMLHVLNEIKKRIPEKLFADNFIPFLQALKVLLFWPAEQYGQTFLNGSSFSTAMLAYIRQAEALSLENKQKVALRAVEDCFFNNADDYTLLNEHKLPSQNTFFRPSFKMIAHDSKTILQQVISYYADILTEVFAQSSIHTKVHNPPSPILQPFVTQELRDKIQAFFPSF